MCDQVLPNLNLLSSGETNANGDASTIENANIQLDMLKLIAEMSLFAGDLKNPEIRLGHIFDRLLVRNILLTIHLLIISTIFYLIIV